MRVPGVLLLLTLALLPILPAEETTTMTRTTSIYDIPVAPMQADAAHTSASLAPWRGEVLLLVNVASQCGFTPQYAGLEALHQKYHDRGLRVVGLPCNDFGGQEPGTEAEIRQFCSTRYNVTFPVMAKLHTLGPEQSPLYHYLTDGESPFKGDVKWNFEKFVISRDGRIVARFPSAVKPDDPKLTDVIEKELVAGKKTE